MINFSEITEQKITEKYERLSQDLKDVLSSVKTSTTIESIAVKYRLNEEKTAMLIQLVGLVILGFASFEEMKEEMKETIDISPQFIPLIADEVRQKIFSPVINSLQKIITEKRPPTPAPTAIPPVPQTITPTPRPVDEYREPMGPEIIDLRKTPPPPISAPVAAAPIPARQRLEPQAMAGGPPTPKSLTFTKPIEPPRPASSMPHLIEADPHKTATPINDESKPQFIIRPPGLPPAPNDILDLRKDRGEF